MLDFIQVNDTNVKTLGLIHSKAWQASHRGIATEAYWNTITPEKQTQYFKEKMQSSDNNYYLIYLDNKPIGMISLNYSPTSKIGEVVQLYFLAEYCGHGYGKEAMDYGITLLKEKGVQTVKLWVMNINQNAQKFYRKYGYQYTGIENNLDSTRNITEQCFELTF